MNLAQFIDHTQLKADTKLEDVKKLCTEADQFSFSAVCVPPYFVKDAAELLENSPVKVATVIGFPMGYSTTAAKVEEIKRALNDGVDEVDVVINLSALKSGNWNYVKNDIDSMSTIIHMKSKLIKVIFETGLLTQDEIRQLCTICKETNTDFVKTSTGMNGEGATIGVVQFLRNILPKEVKIKASGGIRTREDAIRLIDAGAARLGSSAGVWIMNEM